MEALRAAAVTGAGARSTAHTLAHTPQPPMLLLLLPMMMSTPAPCGGVLPRHKDSLRCRAHHIMVSR